MTVTKKESPRAAFRAIFDFYRTGKLRRPVDIPLNIFIQEVQYFEVRADNILHLACLAPQRDYCPRIPRTAIREAARRDCAELRTQLRRRQVLH